MAIALIVEDGSGVLNANSYNSVSSIQGYADARGLSISDDEDVIAQAAIRAMDYIDAKRDEFAGVRSYVNGLSFPRQGVVDKYSPSSNSFALQPNELDNWGLFTGFGLGYAGNFYMTSNYYNQNFLPYNVVPKDIIAAQAYMACMISSGVDAQPTRIGAFVTSRNIGVNGIVTQYSAESIMPSPEFPVFDALIKPYLNDKGGYSLRSSRA